MPEFPNLSRLRYFIGQMYGVDDLRAEQNYFLNRLRRHNRYLHGWGVVAGLEVKVDGGGHLTVQPGLAIDCAGNESALEVAFSMPVPPQATRLYIVVSYVEQETDPVPLPDGTAENSRVMETARIELVAVNPSSGHRNRGPGTPGCGIAHSVCIASIARRQSGWRVTHCNRIA